MEQTTIISVLWMLIAVVAVYGIYCIAFALKGVANAIWDLQPIVEAVKTTMEELRDEQSNDTEVYDTPLVTVLRRLWENGQIPR
jgi:hypothetical protein